MLVSALNNTGISISKGEVVTRTGFTTPEGVITVSLASASSFLSSKVLGVALEDIPNDAIGPIQISGIFTGIDTSGFSVDDKVFLSDTLGEISTSAGTISSIVGVVTIPIVNGSIFIICA